MNKQTDEPENLVELEINTLSDRLDRININDLKNQVKITVDLSIPKKEEEKLEKQKMVTPIREAENFKKIRNMKYAKSLIEQEQIDGNDEVANKIIYEGERAIEYLIKAFTCSAFNFAKSWIHNDRINDRDDWSSIVMTSLFEAIMSYDLNMETQFNTYLKFQIQAKCKDAKSQSTTLSVNPTAMHKRRTIEKAREEMIDDGFDRDDIDELARRLGRDISTPNKRKNFENVLFDMERITPSQVNLDYKKSEDARAISETIASSDVTPEEYAKAKECERCFEEILKTLSQNARRFLKKMYGAYSDDEKMNYCKHEAIKEMQERPELQEILHDLRDYSGVINVNKILIKY